MKSSRLLASFHLAVAFFLFLSCACGAFARAGQLRVSTFNIRWYGLGGSKQGEPVDERRDESLRVFIDKALGKSDVIVFQEIVDVARLKRKVLGAKYKCASYAHDDPKHQHVAVCYKEKYVLAREEGSRSYIFKEMALGTLRPAVLGLLRTTDGEPVAHLIGIHLKSSPGFSEVRRKQAELLSEHLRHLGDKIPMVLLGDFNSYDTQDGSDELKFEEIFARNGLKHVRNKHAFTYNSVRYKGRFDHIWASHFAHPESDVEVLGPCNSDDEQSVEKYNHAISDHCPATVTLSW